MPIKYARFKLSDYHSAGLEYLSDKTGMDATNLIREAITEKIKNDLTEKEQKEIHELIENIVQGTWEEWDAWNRFREEMPPPLKEIWDAALFQSMGLLKQKGSKIKPEDIERLPSVKKLAETKPEDWNHIKGFERYVHHGQYLVGKLIEILYLYRMPILLPEVFEEDWKKVVASEDHKEFERNWNRLDHRLRRKHEEMGLKKLERLRHFMGEHWLASEREAALFLLDLIDRDDRIVRVESKDPDEYVEYVEKEMRESIRKELMEKKKDKNDTKNKK